MRRFVLLVVAADKDSHVNLVVPLVNYDPAHPSIVPAERNPKLKFADIPFPKAKRGTELLRIPVRAARRPLLAPGSACLRVACRDVPVGRRSRRKQMGRLRPVGRLMIWRAGHGLHCWPQMAGAGRNQTRSCRSDAELERVRHTPNQRVSERCRAASPTATKLGGAPVAVRGLGVGRLSGGPAATSGLVDALAGVPRQTTSWRPK